MSSHDRGTGAKEKTDETQQRATLTAQRLTNLAMAGFPSFDQLKARTAKFFARVEKKLEAVPAERQQPAPATIAAPAALQYALLGEGDDVADLREMFENLLTASMDSDTASGAHPAFVSMIQQLTPDEARILKSITRTDYALTTVRTKDQVGHIRERLGFRTTLGSEVGFDVTRQQRCVSNLVRLGILSFSDLTASDFEEQQGALNEAARLEFGDRPVERLVGSLEVTAFGRQFLDTCIRARAK